MRYFGEAGGNRFDNYLFILHYLRLRNIGAPKSSDAVQNLKLAMVFQIPAFHKLRLE